jgi:hypothetical protein
MKLINANDVYYDNDFEKWYFEHDEDFENAQVVEDNYVKENQELKKQLSEKDKEIEQLRKNMEFDTAYYIKELVNIRKQVCEEIYQFIMDNWEKLMGRQGRWQNFNGTCADLKEDLEKIAKRSV